MKLATYKDGSRDGQLVVVSRDLSTAHYATGIAQRLQQALDDWNFLAPQLQDVYDALNTGKARHAFAFDPAQCMAPLPRAYQWLQGRAGDGDDDNAPPLWAAASGDVLGARDAPGSWPQPWRAALGPGLAAITAEVPQGATPGQGLDAVRLLMLSNVITLRALAHDPWQACAAVACGPVAVTPDALGAAWVQGGVQAALHASVNGQRLRADDAPGAAWAQLGPLVSHAARTRRLRAGTVIGCTMPLAAQAAATGLQQGDHWRIEVRGEAGEPLLGSIEQRLAAEEKTPEASE